MAIHFFEEDITKPKIKYRLISRWLEVIIGKNNMRTGDISYIFCDNDYLLGVNKQFLQHDYYTDIITFDYVDNNLVSGDIFISCEMVEENSKKFGVNLEDEFLRVISHGVLHLLGFNDSTEAERMIMRGKESECILFYKEIENGVIKL